MWLGLSTSGKVGPGRIRSAWTGWSSMRFRLESRIVSHHASGTTGGTSGGTAGGFAGAGTGNSEILKGVARVGSG